MEINIALNTIIYIMIFIFPGIIFRKFYYTREYSKEFDKGNLFERTLITILLSVIILTFSRLIFTLFSELSGYDPLPHISYNTIRLLHNTIISSNELPNPNDFKNLEKIVLDFFRMIIGIYLLSAMFGFAAYIINRSKFIKYSGIFKYKNYWQDIINGTYIESPNDKYTLGYTQADVLVATDEGSKLYTGTVDNYYLCHNTNQLQTIVLKDVKRYKKIDNKTITIKIPGHNFTVEKDRILNLNFTYIFVLKDRQKHIKTTKSVINFISIIFYFYATIVAIFFNSDINKYLTTLPRKGIFLICSLFITLILKEFLKNFIFKQWYKVKIEQILFLIVMLTPSIWIFNFLKWYWVLAIEIFMIIVFAIVISRIENEDEKEMRKK